jgi:hypothetical protein
VVWKFLLRLWGQTAPMGVQIVWPSLALPVALLWERLSAGVCANDIESVLLYAVEGMGSARLCLKPLRNTPWTSPFQKQKVSLGAPSP